MLRSCMPASGGLRAEGLHVKVEPRGRIITEEENVRKSWPGSQRRPAAGYGTKGVGGTLPFGTSARTPAYPHPQYKCLTGWEVLSILRVKEHFCFGPRPDRDVGWWSGLITPTEAVPGSEGAAGTARHLFCTCRQRHSGSSL